MSSEAARLFVSVDARLTGLEKGLTQAEARTRAARRNIEKETAGLEKRLALVGGRMQSFGSGATKRVTLPIVGALAFAGKKAMDFEAQLSSLGSVSNATGRDMGRLRKQAMDAGAATKYSALEAAQAQTELAKGGLSVKEILGGGLKAALGLAAAGELSLADAASYTANAMNLFGINASKSTHVADALATAANVTTADVSDFGMALTQGGSAAKAAGLSFDDTVAALETLAAIGIKGSDAGTSLKSALTQLASPTKKAGGLMKELGLDFFDAHGKMKPLPEVAGMLRDKLGGLTREQRLNAVSTLVGQDGMRALLALYEAGPAKVARYEQGLRKQGTAAQVAAQKQDNLKGKVENLMGSIETLAISVGSALLPPLTSLAQKGTVVVGDLAQAFASLPHSTQTAVIGVAGLVAAIGPLSWLVGATATNIGRLIAIGSRLAAVAGSVTAFVSLALSIRSVKDASALASTALGGLGNVIRANPVLFFTGLLLSAALAVGLFGHHSQTAATQQQQFRNALASSRAALDQYRQATDAVKDASLAHSGAVLNLKSAEANLAALRRSKTATPLQLKQAEHDVAVARREVARTTQDLNTAESRRGEETNKATATLRRQLPVLADRAQRERNTIALYKQSIAKAREQGASHQRLTQLTHGLEQAEGQHANTMRSLNARLRELRGSGMSAADRMALLRSALARVKVSGEGAAQEVSALRREISHLAGKTIKVRATVGATISGASKLIGGNPFGGPSGSPRGPVEQALAADVKRQVESSPSLVQQLLGPIAGPGGGTTRGTMRKAQRVASMFGLHVTSGYRTLAHNRAAGGVPNSLHTHGSPDNPGAIDLVGPMGNMQRALAWARGHFSLKEGLIHDAGSGMHLHLGFFAHGGVSPGGLAVVGEQGPELVNLPAGSRVYSHQRSRRMVDDAQAAGVPGFKRGTNRFRPGTYGIAALRRLWIAGGGNAALSTLMAHVAMAESTGRSWARNRSGATGLWQILGNPFRGNAMDPLTNARMAVWKLRHQGLGAWASSRGGWGKWANTRDHIAPGVIRAIRRGKSAGPMGPAAKPKEKPRHGRSGYSLADAITAQEGRVTAADATGGKHDDVRARVRLIKLYQAKVRRIRARIAKINRALKGELTKSTRARLLGERSTLLGDLNSARDQIRTSGGEIREIGNAAEGVDSSGNSTGDSGATGDDPATAAQEEANRLAQQLVDLKKEENAQRGKLLQLTQTQGPALLASVIAAVDGGIGGRVGMGFQSPSVAGRLAAY